uniref:Uncharacterized protein n=1 Tax=Arundo donax TaxID=35708 RepID=A0A0A9A192_ARUDO
MMVLEALSLRHPHHHYLVWR